MLMQIFMNTIFFYGDNILLFLSGEYSKLS